MNIKKIISKALLTLALLTSANATFAAIATTDFGIKITTSNSGSSNNNSWQFYTTDDDFTIDTDADGTAEITITSGAEASNSSGFTLSISDDVYTIDFTVCKQTKKSHLTVLLISNFTKVVQAMVQN
jgi:hypothetical protein